MSWDCVELRMSPCRKEERGGRESSPHNASTESEKATLSLTVGLYARILFSRQHCCKNPRSNSEMP